jgi:hypothetical protein
MTDIGNHQMRLGVKKLVVLEVGRDKHISSGSDGIVDQKTARTTAKRHPAYFLVEKLGMPYTRNLHIGFEQL